MRAAFRYLGRGSWLSRRDPRVLILVPLLLVIGGSQIRDARQLAILLVLAISYYGLARIPWQSVRVQWTYLLGVIGVFALFNALITGGRAGTFIDGPTHVLLTIPPFGAELTAEGISLAASQLLRYAAYAAVGFPVAYALAPGDLAIALRRLGIGDRIAVMVELTVRFIPTLAAEFGETVDAQRVRGYDPTARGGGPIARLRRMAPIFVPVTVGSIAGAEDTIDAMDLRGFGVGRRTWARELRLGRADWLVVGATVAIVGLATFLNLSGQSEHYLLPFLVPA
ncbi:MAG: energy-coupling factor transporter transmembrane component T [Candidatus Limnocylindria bacterium]